MVSTLDMLARRLTELELDGELTTYKAVLAATGCEGGAGPGSQNHSIYIILISSDSCPCSIFWLGPMEGWT